ncbi:MAG: hypothetical protein U0835_26585 [Isosphaeraceae bacterium]
MGPPVETAGQFVREWLAARARDASRPASPLAAGLMATLSPRFGKGPDGLELAGRFIGLLGPRLSAVAALSSRVDAGKGVACRSEWQRDALRLVRLWKEDDPESWWPALVDCVAEGDGLVSALVSGCLDDAVNGGPAARPAVPALRKLREADEAPYRDLTVAPATNAPWDCDEYVCSREHFRLVSAADARVESAVQGHCIPQDLESVRAARALRDWHDAADALASGWPVPAGRLREPLAQLLPLWPEPPGEVVELLAALAPDSEDSRTVEAGGGRSSPESVLMALATSLEADASSEARGRRRGCWRRRPATSGRAA